MVRPGPGMVAVLRRGLATVINDHSGSTLSTLLILFLVQFFIDFVKSRTKARLERQKYLAAQVAEFEVQACLLTNEHVMELGRVEKRTLFIKPIGAVFPNEYLRNMVLEAGRQCGESEPLLLPFIPREARLYVLNTCLAHLSGVFAMYHTHYNDERNEERGGTGKGRHKSAWYSFSMTGHQNLGQGRFFVTPSKSASHDVGAYRLRIVIVAEAELASIASGSTRRPRNFFSPRHRGRWRVIEHMAEYFSEEKLKAGRSLGNVEDGDNQPLESNYDLISEAQGGAQAKELPTLRSKSMQGGGVLRSLGVAQEMKRSPLKKSSNNDLLTPLGLQPSPSRTALASASRNSSEVDLDDGSMLYEGKKISEYKHVMLRMHVPILVP
jgi:hypothetical protein